MIATSTTISRCGNRPSIWDYFHIRADGDPAVVLAEHMLLGPDDDTVVIAFSQSHDRVDTTRGELRAQVATVATVLRALGVRRGDRVDGYLPNIPETLIAMLATTSIGAIWACCARNWGRAA